MWGAGVVLYVLLAGAFPFLTLGEEALPPLQRLNAMIPRIMSGIPVDMQQPVRFGDFERVRQLRGQPGLKSYLGRVSRCSSDQFLPQVISASGWEPPCSYHITELPLCAVLTVEFAGAAGVPGVRGPAVRAAKKRPGGPADAVAGAGAPLAGRQHAARAAAPEHPPGGVWSGNEYSDGNAERLACP